MHPISYLQALALGLLHGVSELFPVSSLGHSVILPRVLGWDIHQNDDYFITFLVATHLATALVLLGFFWTDWVRIVSGILRSLRDREIGPEDTDAKLGWLLVVNTIPAGLLGLLLEHSLRHVFASPTSAAIFLTLNGVLLWGAERLRRRAPGPDPLLPDADARIVIPFGVAALRIGIFGLWPFGRTGVRRADAGAGAALGNVLWFLLCGWSLALVHLITGALLCLTIIGIPLGLANFKLIPVSLLPFEREIVSIEETQAQGLEPIVAVPADSARR